MRIINQEVPLDLTIEIDEVTLNLFNIDGITQGFFFSIKKKGDLEDTTNFELEFRNSRVFHDEIYIEATHRYGHKGLMVIFHDQFNAQDMKEIQRDLILEDG